MKEFEEWRPILPFLCVSIDIISVVAKFGKDLVKISPDKEMDPYQFGNGVTLESLPSPGLQELMQR